MVMSGYTDADQSLDATAKLPGLKFFFSILFFFQLYWTTPAIKKKKKKLYVFNVYNLMIYLGLNFVATV